jgi:hypothetical protein
VSEIAPFSIQPIGNNVEDGIGPAYRIEPSGKVFNNPLEISIQYNEEDVEGTFAGFLRIAFQDEEGAWREQSSAKLDTANHRVTVPTTHLSDWSFYMGEYIRIIPSKADVRVGKKVRLTVKTCNLIGAWFTKKVCKERGWGSENPNAWTLKGPGKLTQDWPGIIYTAPAKQPKPNVVTVIYHAALFPPDISDLEAKIRILGTGYRVSGAGGDGGLPVQAGTYSGVICSLEEPFTLYASANNYDFKFTPSSESNGAWTAETTIGAMSIKGTGTYAIENIESDKPRIKLTGAVTGTLLIPPYASSSASGTHFFDLTRLDTDECGEPTPTPTPVITPHPLLKGKGPL